MQLLAGLHAEGSTICMVTHDPRYAQHASREVHLFDGQVVDGLPRGKAEVGGATLALVDFTATEGSGGPEPGGQSVSPPRGRSSSCPSKLAASGTPVAAEAVADGPAGGRRSPSTSSSVRLAHPGLAAGVDVAPPAAAELLEASRPSGTGAAATGRSVEPDALPRAPGDSRTGRGRSRRRHRAT